MFILDSEIMKYKNKAILKETTDRKKPKIIYSSNYLNKFDCYYTLKDIKKAIDKKMESEVE